MWLKIPNNVYDEISGDVISTLWAVIRVDDIDYMDENDGEANTIITMKNGSHIMTSVTIHDLASLIGAKELT